VQPPHYDTTISRQTATSLQVAYVIRVVSLALATGIGFSANHGM
jgi:hypothetical protein